MPGRKTVLANNETYHILNRGISHQLTFKTKRDFSRAIETLRYYQNEKLPMRFSQFALFSKERKEEAIRKIANKKQFLVKIVAFCLMPNHFHFILEQIKDGGIASFMSKFTNSYTRYFNVKNRRHGPLFQGKFKAVRVESEAQLLHLSRYIHLNPYSSYIIRNTPEIENYPYSSFREYLGKSKIEFCNKEDILSQFKNRYSYRKFVFEQASYQRTLQTIKSVALEEP